MTQVRKTEKIVGILFILATATYMSASIILGKLYDTPDYLKHIYPHKTQLILAFFLEFINNMAVLGMGILLHKLLKPFNEKSALWYFVTRFLETTILIISGLGLLMLLPISEEYIKTNAVHLQTFGKIAREWHFLAFEVAMFFTASSGLILCFLIYSKKLIPRLISIIGIIGYALIFGKSIVDIFGFDTGSILYIPGAIFELVFPIWLIIRGFNRNNYEK
jgi:Domain of unknown function (DUF4386)